MQRIKMCPMCGREIHYGDFVSRRDNKTRICGLCAFFEAADGLAEWKTAWKQGVEKKSAPQ